MAVTLTTAARNAAADAIADLVDVGGAGNLIFKTAADAEVATLGFAATAFGSASGGTVTANSISPDTNATGGTIAKAEIQNGSAASVAELSVTATGGGGDIELTSLNIGSGDTVSLTSLTLTQPAS